jgi:hypothetical protein
MVSESPLGYIYIKSRQESSGRPKRWYCLNRFTLSQHQAPHSWGFLFLVRIAQIRL